MTPLLIVGAGPAGLAAAREAVRHGVAPLVVDNRPEPGGNIYAWLDSQRTARPERLRLFGRDYAKGAGLLDAFQAAVAAGRIAWRPSTRLWQVNPDGSFALEGPAGSETGRADQIILATGAQERPMPLPGWTLPGVMGAGAAQILMKAGGALPAGDIVLVGAGPLPLLVTEQLRRAGRPVAAVVEPAGGTNLTGAVLTGAVLTGAVLTGAGIHLLNALAAPVTVLKGLALLARRIRHRTPVWKAATDIRILGDRAVTGLAFRCGQTVTLPAASVLLHDGIVPNLNPPRAAGLAMTHAPRQHTWHARSGGILQVAGDGAGILGVDGALVSGRMAAARACGQQPAAGDRLTLKRLAAFRRFLDSAWPPVRTARDAPGSTLLCRCEQVTAAAVRKAIAAHGPDPNALKRALRIGMGPCQGRMCAHSLADCVAAATGTTPDRIGLPNARPPILPVTFGTLADLETRD